MPDFSYLGAILLSIAVLAYYLFFYRNRQHSQRLCTAIDFLRDAVYMTLYLELDQTHESGHASKVAGTVVNEVFGFEPPDKEAKDFRESHKSEVQKTINRLTEMSEVRPLVGAALRLMETSAYTHPAKPKGGLSRGFNLGLVDPVEETLPIHAFLSRTATFHRRIKKEFQAAVAG